MLFVTDINELPELPPMLNIGCWMKGGKGVSFRSQTLSIYIIAHAHLFAVEPLHSLARAVNGGSCTSFQSVRLQAQRRLILLVPRAIQSSVFVYSFLHLLLLVGGAVSRGLFGDNKARGSCALIHSPSLLHPPATSLLIKRANCCVCTQYVYKTIVWTSHVVWRVGSFWIVHWVRQCLYDASF